MPEPTTSEVQAWFSGRVPDGWFAGPPDISMDGDEMLIVGSLPDVEVAKGSKADARAAARSARIDRFREVALGFPRGGDPGARWVELTGAHRKTMNPMKNLAGKVRNRLASLRR